MSRQRFFAKCLVLGLLLVLGGSSDASACLFRRRARRCCSPPCTMTTCCPYPAGCYYVVFAVRDDGVVVFDSLFNSSGEAQQHAAKLQAQRQTTRPSAYVSVFPRKAEEKKKGA